MSGVSITVDIDDKDIQRGFSKAARAMSRPEGLMSNIGTDLVKGTTRRFRTKTAPDGSAWQINNSGYAAGKRKGILVESTILRDSITHRVERDSVRVGTNVKYAAIHQFGGTIKPKKGTHLKFKIAGQWVAVKSVTIPARPYLGVDDEDKVRIARRIDRFLERAFSGS